MRVIEDNEEFNKYMESETLRQSVRNNAIRNLRDLVQESINLNIAIESEENRQTADDIMQNNITYSADTAASIVDLWKDPSIQLIYTKGHQNRKSRRLSRRMENFYFARDDFFDHHLERILKPDYVPTTEDFIHLKSTNTRGTNTESEFQIVHMRGLNVRIDEVQSGKNSRMTWQSKFSNADFIVFFASLTAYANILEGKSQLEDSIALFKEVLGLVKGPCLLLFSKPDVLPAMLHKVPLGMCYQDYQGDLEVNEAIEVIKEMYLAQCNESEKQRVHPMVLNITNTEEVEKASRVLSEMILYGDRFTINKLKDV
jgi:hypothetical protein